MTKDNLSELMTFNEVAQALKIKVATLRKWAFERRMPIVRVGLRAVRIPTAWVTDQIKKGYRPAQETR